MPASDPLKDKSPLPIKTTLLVCVVIVLIGVVFTGIIFNTEPEAKREAATKRTAMLVDVITAQGGDFRPVIDAMGTVQPAQQIILRPQVSGQIIAHSQNFVPGGMVKKGEVLLEVEPADYQHLLQQRQSELTQAVTTLEIEMGEQALAKKDFKRLGQNLSPMQQNLVLREPQLRGAKARVAAAKSVLAQAQLNLERTRIKAPFDAQVLSRHVNVGSQISPGVDLAELVGLQTYWVEATVPLAKLHWLAVADKNAEDQIDPQPTDVRIRNRTAWPQDTYRRGHLHSIIGALEGQTRMARVLIAVADPLATQPENSNAMPLIVGSYVECQLQAQTLQNVVRLEREYVRKNNTAWVMENNALTIRQLAIDFQDQKYAYIKTGLHAGEQVVTTSLARVSEGAELRLNSPKNSVSGTE